MGKQANVYIFSHGQDVPRYLPKWFIHLENIYTHYITRNLFNSKLGLTSFNYPNFSIEVSSPERAFFEVLSLVPNKASFEHACQLAQLQRTLRAELVQQLLQECKSCVLSRLFLYLAPGFDFYCLPRLRLEKIDLGQGMRQVGKAEVFDKELNPRNPIALG